MILENWLDYTETSIEQFAYNIGKNRSLVHKYIYEDVIPRREAMEKIYCVTLGSVRADDFYGLSDKMLEKYRIKSCFSRGILHPYSFK